MSIQDEILADHQRMWNSFCRWTTVGIVIVVVIVAVVMLLVTR
jgi:hypothetical protein